MDPEAFFNELLNMFRKRGQVKEEREGLIELHKGFLLFDGKIIQIMTDNVNISINPVAIPDDANIKQLRRAIFKILYYTGGIARKRVERM